MAKVWEDVNDLPLIQAAQTYAVWGWPVFPVMPKRKEPLIREGFKGATTDLDQIAAWWRKWPDANVGSPTGASVGHWVLDVDVADGKPGLASLATLVARYGALDTLEVRTGSGGRHLLFALADGGAPSRVGILPGLDARGEGGYVVLPPSLHGSGARYQWTQLDREIAHTPDWLADLLRRPTIKPEAAGGRAGTVEGWGAIGWWHGGPIEKGTRNQTLFSIACSAVARGYDQEAVLGLVSRINHRHCTEPVSMDEVEKLVGSACTKGPTYQRNDVGNAQAMMEYAAGRFVWVPELKTGGWHEYNGTKWEPTSEKSVWRTYHSLLAYWGEMARRLGDEGGADLKKWVSVSSNDGKIRATTSQYSSMVDTSIQRFNEGLDLLPLSNGQTIFLGTDGKWEPRTSRLEDYSLNALPISFDREAKCPTWERAMRVWTEGDKKKEEFLWRWMGCLLTGRLLHHKMMVIVGPTKGGKTTLSEALNTLLGSFSQGMSVDLLTNERNFNRDAEKARLFGKRLAYFSEATSASEFHPETIKNLTGEDLIRARPLYAVAFNFQMTAKLLLHTNEVPTAKQVDPALENRLLFLEWCSTIPPEERDPRLREKLVSEGPGWLTRCLVAYEAMCVDLGRGLSEDEALRVPQSVTDAVRAYRDDMDMVQRWLEECCTLGEKERVRRSETWRSWTDWAKENRVSRGKQQTFWSQLKAKGFDEIAPGGDYYWRGLSINVREVVID